MSNSHCVFSFSISEFLYFIRDHVAYSQLPYLSPAPKGTVAELDSFQESRVKDRALLRDVVNVIPQVTESHEQEGLAKQIALAHRRYVLAAGAEFKKLVVKDEPPKQTSAPHYITPQTAVVPKPCVNRGRRLATEQRSSPRVNRDQNAIAPASDIKSRRRMAILDSGALAHELNAMLSYRAASEVWV